MYKWYIRLYFKSGRVLDGYVNSDHISSEDVVKQLTLANKDVLNGMYTFNESSLVFYNDNIEACEISAKKFT